MIDLELYRIFVIVANENNITKASEILHISQPAVSKHIKDLEDNLQVKLFNRTNHGIKLTNKGNCIYNDIKEHIYALENIYNKYQKNISINMGAHNTILNKLFNKKISNYYKVNNNVKINIINEGLIEMLTKLEKQELDIILTKKDPNYENSKIEFLKLGELHDILFTSKDSEIKDKIITLEELKEEVIYIPRKRSATVSNFYESLKLTKNDFKNINNIPYSTMIDIIKNTGEIGVITKEYIEKELMDKEILELKTSFKLKPIEYGIYINKNNRFKELIELIEILSIENEN